MMNKLILFELNEVPIKIMDYYRTMRPDSWIAKNFDRFNKFESYSENIGHLSPWNTWPTLHRGVSNEKHLISDFNQNLQEVDREFPPIWKILSDHKIGVGVFGSLHSYPLPDSYKDYAFYVPDVFSPSGECHPKYIELFQNINLKLSRESARNVDRKIPFVDAIKLGLKSGKFGFKAGTISEIGSHLVSERFSRWKTVRRRTYQSVLAFDVFYKLLSKNKPDFVTFFTNHVASSQHRYWAALFPTDYENLKYDQDWINTYSNEILFTMDKADEMLAKLGKFVNRYPEYKLVIASSMGQNAIESEPLETQLYIVDHEKFMACFGIAKSEFQIKPAMLPQFNYEISVGKINEFKTRLSSAKINQSSISFRDLGNNRFSIDLGHQNLKMVEFSIGDNTFNLSDCGLKNVEIEDKSNATAYHIPEGHLYVYHPTNSATLGNHHAELVPTCELVPTILANYGIGEKDYMKKASKVILS
jgi:hypothetical protein